MIHSYRSYSILRNRVRNKLSSYFNRLRLWLYGIKIGKNCVIHGLLYIRLFKTAKVSIGDNFYMSNGDNVNALASNKRGSFYATSDAEITIGDNVGMSSTVLWCHKRISIGNNVKIGANVYLIDTDSHSLDFVKRRNPMTDWSEPKEIVIGDDAFIGMNSIILKGVHIGVRAIIGAGSVVTQDIPEDCIAGGNPAKIIKRF